MAATHATLTERLTDFLRDYYREEIAQLVQRYPRDQKSLYVDYDDVFQFDPDVADDLREEPEEILDYFDEALWRFDLPVDVSLGQAQVRVYNLPEDQLLDVAEVRRYENIGHLLDVRGQVQKVSDVKPRVVTAAWECQRCGTLTRLPQHGDELQDPHECQGCERQGPFRLNSSQSEWTNHQYARLQQPPERTQGGEGQQVDVHLEDDLIQAFEAGDRVTLTGILDIEDASSDDARDFDTNLDGRAVIREESDYDDIDVDAHLEEIQAIANGEEGDPYELLVDSINPEHRGDEDVKLALALQMFGGWSRGSNRGESHVLLMGDPGCGKSTFLQAIDRLAPRSTYASGKGATAAGLTAAAVADDFGDTEWSLEAGALVLANGGVACIDEIDKVPEDAVSALHDTLESRKVRVHKAGINAMLEAKTALVAAGNPRDGRFDSYQPKAQQLDLSPTLMSRFDLMLMVSDAPDADEDRDVVEHMMRSRRAAAKQELGEDLTEDERRSIEPAIPRDVLRAYIAYAKEEVTPYIRESAAEAQEYLKDEFLKLRLANAEDEDNPVPVTFRKEEAIERLAEASARVRLSDEVTKADVDRALRLVRKSMRQVGIDPETGEMDADIVETGQSKSQRERRKHVKAIVADQSWIRIEEIAEIVGESERTIENDVGQLKERGQLVVREGKVCRTEDL